MIYNASTGQRDYSLYTRTTLHTKKFLDTHNATHVGHRRFCDGRARDDDPLLDEDEPLSEAEAKPAKEPPPPVALADARGLRLDAGRAREAVAAWDYACYFAGRCLATGLLGGQPYSAEDVDRALAEGGAPRASEVGFRVFFRRASDSARDA